MSDQRITKVIDTEWEHSQHTAYDKNCSTCFSEALRVEASREAYNKYAFEEAWGRNEQIDDPSWRENPLE